MMKKYIVTVTSILDEEHHGHHNKKEVTKNIPVFSNIDLPNDVIDYEKQYNVVFISSTIRPLHLIYDNVKDSVCIYSTPSSNDEEEETVVTEICNELETLGALAFITKVKPKNDIKASSSSSSFPVLFATENEYIPDIPYLSATSIYATFDIPKQHEKNPIPPEEADHDESNDDNDDESYHIESDDDDDHEHDHDESFYCDSDDDSHNSNYNYQFRNKFNTLLLYDDEQYLDGFVHGLKLIHQSIKEDGENVVVAELYQFLSCNGYNLGILVALASVINKNIDHGKSDITNQKELTELLLHRIGHLSIKTYEKYVITFLKTSNETMLTKLDGNTSSNEILMLPQDVLYHFLVSNVALWGSSDVDTIENCLCMLHASGLLTRFDQNDWDTLRSSVSSSIFHYSKKFYIAPRICRLLCIVQIQND
jgi:hypothetical protein